MVMLLSEDVNRDMKELLNQRATHLKKELQVLNNRLEEIRIRENETASVLDLAQSWKTADYECKRNITTLMIHQILISESGDVNIVWNL